MQLHIYQEDINESIRNKKPQQNLCQQCSCIKGINLTVEKGDFFALLGPNGAGKTSLINILTQLNRIDEGHIEVFGLDLRKEPLNIKRMIGLVPQEFNFNMFLTVQQILFYSAGYYGLSPKAQAPRINMILKKL